MKALSFILALFIILPLCLCGCNVTENSKVTTPESTEGATDVISIQTEYTDSGNIIELQYGELWINDTDIVAIAYLCGGGSETKAEAESKVEDLSSIYRFNTNGIECIDLNGWSWYLVLPRNKDTEITIISLDSDGNQIEIVNKTKNPFFICCEKSDIIADTKININYNDISISYCFLPNLSGSGLFSDYIRIINQYWGCAISVGKCELSNTELFDKYSIAESDVTICDFSGDRRVLIIPTSSVQIGVSSNSIVEKHYNKPFLLLAGDETIHIEVQVCNMIYTADIIVSPDGTITGNSFLRSSLLLIK